MAKRTGNLLEWFVLGAPVAGVLLAVLVALPPRCTASRQDLRPAVGAGPDVPSTPER